MFINKVSNCIIYLSFTVLEGVKKVIDDNKVYKDTGKSIVIFYFVTNYIQNDIEHKWHLALGEQHWLFISDL